MIHIYSRYCIIHSFPKHYYGDIINQNYANGIKILQKAVFPVCYLLQQYTNAITSRLMGAMNPGKYQCQVILIYCSVKPRQLYIVFAGIMLYFAFKLFCCFMVQQTLTCTFWGDLVQF